MADHSVESALESRPAKAASLSRMLRLSRHWIARTANAFRASLYPHTALETQLVNAQLKMIRTATKPFVYILPPASVLVAWANAAWVTLPLLVVWCTVVSLASILFDLIFRSVEKTTGDDAEGVGKRARTFCAMGTAQAAIWASMGIVLWVPDQPVNHMLLVLILASTISGWSAMGAVHMAVGRIPLICYAAVMIGAPLFSSTTLDHAIAGMCAAFTFAMVVNARTTYDTTRKMLCLQFERSGLIANLRRAKEDSDTARTRAETASLAKSQFLANMSHELRTPMNAILGFSEIINTKALGGDIDKYAEYAGLIHNSGKHLLSLINDILDLAKIEAGRMELLEEDVDLASLALDAIRLLAQKADEARITLTTEIDRGLPLVLGDERAMRQILMNLLSNAVKFTPYRGRITIFASGDVDGMIFGVEDTGIGIEEDDLPRVFESFGQGRHDITTYEKGTGLGLPIVKGLVEAHGGTVTLTSQRESGTRVTVFLPAERMRARPMPRLISTGIPSVRNGSGWGA